LPLFSQTAASASRISTCTVMRTASNATKETAGSSSSSRVGSQTESSSCSVGSVRVSPPKCRRPAIGAEGRQSRNWTRRPPWQDQRAPVRNRTTGIVLSRMRRSSSNARLLI
jgi:hypothetical protein